MLLAILGPGEMFGEMAILSERAGAHGLARRRCRRSRSSRSCAPTSRHCVSASRASPTCSSRRCCDLVQRLTTQVSELSELDGSTRLYRQLWRLGEVFEKRRAGAELPISQQQLASMTGVGSADHQSGAQRGARRRHPRDRQEAHRGQRLGDGATACGALCATAPVERFGRRRVRHSMAKRSQQCGQCEAGARRRRDRRGGSPRRFECLARGAFLSQTDGLEREGAEGACTRPFRRCRSRFGWWRRGRGRGRAR